MNSDDILIFDSDVSKEYLRLYEAETITTYVNLMDNKSDVGNTTAFVH